MFSDKKNRVIKISCYPCLRKQLISPFTQAHCTRNMSTGHHSIPPPVRLDDELSGCLSVLASCDAFHLEIILRTLHFLTQTKGLHVWLSMSVCLVEPLYHFCRPFQFDIVGFGFAHAPQVRLPPTSDICQDIYFSMLQ